jgi:5-methylthioadenosine/S-adenosylhomocysteine deaminase
MKFVLLGRVATMDGGSTVVPDGAVYVDGNTIAAVADRRAPPPAGFAGSASVETGGTLFPGLIELHNHLSYDALALWNVPARFTNRAQWQGNADYKARVSGPMATIAQSGDDRLLAALARYVETKCLIGGVATSQGIALKTDDMQTSYRSAMRVVDDPADAAFPKASTHIPDVAATDWSAFRAQVESASCMLLHLSEGLDDEARAAFLSLQHDGQWALGPALAGIHCAALQPQDFAILQQNGASVVWSPLSNLMLYGGTTDIRAARAAGLTVALGSDWSPSGSKNLLNELKVARAASDVLGIGLTDRDIVAMVTSAPARIVRWDRLVGSIAAGKRADFTVIAATAGADPYASLVQARETDMTLLMIDGQPVLGAPALMSALGAAGETIRLGAAARVVNFGAGDPRVPKVTFAEARAATADALSRLPTLLHDEKKGQGVAGHALAGHAPGAARLRLALHEEHLSGCVLRTRLPVQGKPTGPDAAPADVAAAVSALAVPLDPVAVAEDAGYGDKLEKLANLPDGIRSELKRYFA